MAKTILLVPRPVKQYPHDEDPSKTVMETGFEGKLIDEGQK